MIEIGEQISLIYSFNTPSSVGADDIATTELVATAVPVQAPNSAPVPMEPLVETTQSRAIIEDGGLLLLKSAAVRSDASEIDYRIIARNNAETPLAAYNSVDGQPLLVDGEVRSGILVRDPIPLNTTCLLYTSPSPRDRG